MKNTIKVNHEQRKLIMDRTFEKNAINVRSAEYELLQKVRNDYPEYIVEVRHIKRNTQRETYKGLTYAYMRRYINRYEEEDKRATVLDEMEQLLTISQCHSMGKRYPQIKKWFLAKYPEIAKYGMKSFENDNQDLLQENNEQESFEDNIVAADFSKTKVS